LGLKAVIAGLIDTPRARVKKAAWFKRKRTIMISSRNLPYFSTDRLLHGYQR
jgi:hypothetical protein